MYTRDARFCPEVSKHLKGAPAGAFVAWGLGLVPRPRPSLLPSAPRTSTRPALATEVVVKQSVNWSTGSRSESVCRGILDCRQRKLANWHLLQTPHPLSEIRYQSRYWGEGLFFAKPPGIYMSGRNQSVTFGPSGGGVGSGGFSGSPRAASPSVLQCRPCQWSRTDVCSPSRMREAAPRRGAPCRR